MSETATKKPFATTKPRSHWRKPKRRVRGRVLHDVQVGANPEDTAIFVYELKSDGLHVRQKHKRKEKLWTFDNLANGVGVRGGQMTLIR